MFKKKRNLVIMDGSNIETVKAVLGVVRMIGGDKCIKRCKRLDDSHPTMKVINYRTDSRTSEDIKEVLDKVWPGLCIYNVAV